MPEQNLPSRRTVLKTGAWAAPAIVVATAAPVLAASPGTISGVQRVLRNSATTLLSEGTVTNLGTSAATVTLTWLWTADSTGPGAGTLIQGRGGLNGWALASLTLLNSQNLRLIASRSIAARDTVPIPAITVTVSGASVRGTVTATLAAPAPAIVVQPAAVFWLPFVAGGRTTAPPRPAPGDITTDITTT